jgi:hypothetical protein
MKLLNIILGELVREYVKPAKESEVDPLELKKGIEVEMEHTDSSKVAKRIALQHLAEDPKYYTKLGTLKLQESVEIKYQDPNFETEWEEALRYPEFEEMGKDGWLDVAKKGKTVSYNGIRKYLGNVDLNFISLEEPKKERFKRAFQKGVIEKPIAVKFSDTDYDLVAGNTRLAGLLDKGYNPQIWVVDISTLNESTTSGMIGPFFHETDSQNVDNILQNGIIPKGGLVSISPGERTDHYGDQVFEVYLTPVQFMGALRETLGWVEEDLPEDELDNIKILLKSRNQDLIFNANELIQDPLFMMGELVCPFSIPPSQVKLLDQKKNISLNKENFADGKVKGKSRPGRVKRAGASCKGSVTDLRAKAKKYGGEKGKMYHWCANMKSGKK